MTTTEVLEVALPATAGALHVAGRVLAHRAHHRPPAAPATREDLELERVRELFASDRITLAELEDATGRVLRGEPTFPPVAPDVWALRETGRPLAPGAVDPVADRAARRDARERERWRH